MIISSRYDQASFGSWLVEVEADPPVRVLWDGKDNWLVVQTAEHAGVWTDWWVGKEQSQQSAENAARKVVKRIRQDGV